MPDGPRPSESFSLRPRRLIGPRLALLAALLGACAHSSGAGALAKPDSWAGGVIDPTNVRTVAIDRVVRDPKDDSLCSDFRRWLEKNEITLYSCSLKRLVLTGGDSGGVPMFAFSGLTQPHWWATDAGQFMEGRTKIARGRWRLELLQIPSAVTGGDVQIVLSTQKIKGGL